MISGLIFSGLVTYHEYGHGDRSGSINTPRVIMSKGSVFSASSINVFKQSKAKPIGITLIVELYP